MKFFCSRAIAMPKPLGWLLRANEEDLRFLSYNSRLRPQTLQLRAFARLSVGVIDTVELGDLEAHHVPSAIPHQLQLVVGLGVTHNDLGSHFCVFLVRDAVHGEKL